MTENGYNVLECAKLEAPEVGQPIDLELGAVQIRATWLGTVRNGRELGQAMRLMAQLAEERGINETLECERNAVG